MMEYKLLTSEVVKDLYCNPPSRQKSYTRIKNRIVSWEYSEKWWGYLICHIDVEGYPRWIF